jgi:DhnA family fructose-bisphosphate aldolase class Ia
MARGWESKAVEGQVQEFESKEDRQNKKQLSQVQIEARRHRQVLLLARARVEKQLQSNQDSRYREQLTRALADLDAQLAALSREAT